jgi:anhydro-N-acetylmuramic acid kinase
MAKLPTLRIAGVMSGTSLDGVDVVLCRCTPNSVERLHQGFQPFPRALATRLHAAARGDATGWEVAQLHHDLGRTYARQVAAVLAGQPCQAIALHGQTIFHQPNGSAAATFQLGEPAYLAEMLKVPVVSNFRAGDLAAGGQGAPLATRFHRVAFARPGRFIAVQNLGGIGNVTALDWTDPRRAEPEVLAFDTGPANVLLDLAARHLSKGRRTCDRDGRLAAKGTVDLAALSQWLRHPYFRRRPPKSTGRELFGEPFFQNVLAEWRQPLPDSGPDLLATLTEFTAQSVALNYRRHLPGAAF